MIVTPRTRIVTMGMVDLVPSTMVPWSLVPCYLGTMAAHRAAGARGWAACQSQVHEHYVIARGFNRRVCSSGVNRQMPLAAVSTAKCGPVPFLACIR